jgi:DNA gyrase subunit B
MAKTAAGATYSAQDIKHLVGLDKVRQLPGMYIGNNSSYGLHHLLKELFHNSADEVMNGYGTLIRVTLHEDGSATVWDDGRGIPVEWVDEPGGNGDPPIKMSALTKSLTILHAGGKFSGGSAYASSGGLHGVGAKAANAMSQWMTVTVRRGGLIFRQRFVKGGEFSKGVEIINPGKKEQVVGEIGPQTRISYGKNGVITTVKNGRKSLPIQPDPNLTSGTEIRFLPHRPWFDPDMEWNGIVPWDFDHIRLGFRQFVFLNAGLRVELSDLRGKQPKHETLYAERGLLDYIDYLNEGFEPVHDTIIFSAQGDDSGDITVEVAMQYTKDGDDTQIYSFVNGIPTPLGGTHVSGFQAGLTKAVNKLSSTKTAIRGDDLLLGLSAVIKLIMNKTPQFSSQTKESLTTADVRGVATSVTYNELVKILSKKKSIVNAIARQAEAAARGREAAKKARQLVIRRSVLDAPDDTGLLAKLADTARDTPMEQRILFLVEGDSAGGSCKLARDRRYHAILASRGKVINAEKSKILRVLGNKEIKAFVAALGAGVGPDFKLEDRRYGRIAIFCDADVDGYHIRALWYTFIWRYMRPLITEGHLFVAEAPLYRVYNGKKEVYAYSEKERLTALKKLGKGAGVQRYKGLGEMNPDQLRYTTLNPGRERLLPVTIDDVHSASQMVNMLMGTNTSARKDWIMETWLEA